jgi:hypothetical protein
VAENYRLSLTPVLVIDLRAVFCRDRWHGYAPLFMTVSP